MGAAPVEQPRAVTAASRAAAAGRRSFDMRLGRPDAAGAGSRNVAGNPIDDARILRAKKFRAPEPAARAPTSDDAVPADAGSRACISVVEGGPRGVYEDRTLTCRDCGESFVFSSGEQAFFASKGLTNDPQRCPTCRAAAKRARNASPGGISRVPRGHLQQLRRPGRGAVPAPERPPGLLLHLLRQGSRGRGRERAGARLIRVIVVAAYAGLVQARRSPWA